MNTKLGSTRRAWLLQGLAAWAAVAAPAHAATGVPVQVWKSPTCGCCKDWVAVLERAGFAVQVFDTGNNAVRARLGLPQALGSCHTARVGAYVLEGHVPVREIQRLLREKPQALGLAVPGMPIGSPGMDGAAYEGRKDAFDVLLVRADGSTSVYQRYPAGSQ